MHSNDITCVFGTQQLSFGKRIDRSYRNIDRLYVHNGTNKANRLKKEGEHQ